MGDLSARSFNTSAKSKLIKRTVDFLMCAPPTHVDCGHLEYADSHTFVELSGIDAGFSERSIKLCPSTAVPGWL